MLRAHYLPDSEQAVSEREGNRMWSVLELEPVGHHQDHARCTGLGNRRDSGSAAQIGDRSRAHDRIARLHRHSHRRPRASGSTWPFLRRPFRAQAGHFVEFVHQGRSLPDTSPGRTRSPTPRAIPGYLLKSDLTLHRGAVSHDHRWRASSSGATDAKDIGELSDLSGRTFRPSVAAPSATDWSRSSPPRNGPG